MNAMLLPIGFCVPERGQATSEVVGYVGTLQTGDGRGDASVVHNLTHPPIKQVKPPLLLQQSQFVYCAAHTR
jgi:hypothetical protein